MGFEYHLDDIYRDRWITYHFADGTVEDSRRKHWRQTEWEKVVKLEMNIKGHTYAVMAGPGHKGFITYRTMGFDWHIGKHGIRRQHPTHTWRIGWMDSTHAHITEADFKTGKLIGELKEPIASVEAHIHPRLKQQWDRNWNVKTKERRAAHAVESQGHL